MHILVYIKKAISLQVYFKQLCCKCQKKFNPYRVEAIQCQVSAQNALTVMFPYVYVKTPSLSVFILQTWLLAGLLYV